jgi:hypothetical protein
MNDNFITSTSFPSFSLSALPKPSKGLQIGKPPQPKKLAFGLDSYVREITYCECLLLRLALYRVLASAVLTAAMPPSRLFTGGENPTLGTDTAVHL